MRQIMFKVFLHGFDPANHSKGGTKKIDARKSSERRWERSEKRTVSNLSNILT